VLPNKLVLLSVDINHCSVLPNQLVLLSVDINHL
jgi:hypothetical protein